MLSAGWVHKELTCTSLSFSLPGGNEEKEKAALVYLYTIWVIRLSVFCFRISKPRLANVVYHICKKTNHNKIDCHTHWQSEGWGEVVFGQVWRNLCMFGFLFCSVLILLEPHVTGVCLFHLKMKYQDTALGLQASISRHAELEVIGQKEISPV